MLQDLRTAIDPPSRQILEFDSACQQLLAKFWAVKIEKMEPDFEYINFPPPAERPAELSFDLPELSATHASYGDGERKGEFRQNPSYQDMAGNSRLDL
jgi:hypothetical protein